MQVLDLAHGRCLVWAWALLFPEWWEQTMINVNCHFHPSHNGVHTSELVCKIKNPKLISLFTTGDLNMPGWSFAPYSKFSDLISHQYESDWGKLSQGNVSRIQKHKWVSSSSGFACCKNLLKNFEKALVNHIS